jgi:hypothetical protein
MLVTYQEFADVCGKSRQAIAKAVKTGRLEDAGDRKIDTESELAKMYSESNQHNTGGVRKSKKNIPQAGTMDRASLENERLRQQIIKLDLENNIKIGKHVPRNLVEEYVIAPINELFIKIIADLPRTLLIEIKQAINAGMTDGEIEQKIKTHLESYIKRAKSSLKKWRPK